MKMRDRSGIPGATGQGACEETARVVDKVCDDHHFDDLERKLGGGGRGCGGGLPTEYLWKTIG